MLLHAYSLWEIKRKKKKMDGVLSAREVLVCRFAHTHTPECVVIGKTYTHNVQE